MDRGRTRAAVRGPLLALLVATSLVVAACGSSEPSPSAPAASPSATPASTDVSGLTPSATAAPSATVTPVATPPAAARPIAGSGSIAVVHADGSLWLVDAAGPSMQIAGDGAAYGFPTWSPDGKSIAVIQTSSTDTSIVVFDVERATSLLPGDPKVIFRSPAILPFYLSWTPDGKQVSFLATEDGGIGLRIAPADGSAPLDGSGPGALVRAGSPFYYDWIDPGHLFAHIGDGADAFLGEIDTKGTPAKPAVKSPGTFRSADVSADGKFVGYVRAGKEGKDAIVVAARDGSGEQTMPVSGIAAVDFGPIDDTLAAIGSIEPSQAPLAIPVGPLRLIDARSGATRTLLEGLTVSFAWSPDGKTIAAIRVVPVADGSSVSSASPTTSPAPAARNEVRLTFVDVASGETRSELVVAPGERYVNALMTYFDQYALSHHLWAPDSSSILLPQVDAAGTTHVDVVYPDGGAPVSLDGEIGFWSP